VISVAADVVGRDLFNLGIGRSVFSKPGLEEAPAAAVGGDLGECVTEFASAVSRLVVDRF
jgi:hypothetical protein